MKKNMIWKKMAELTYREIEIIMDHGKIDKSDVWNKKYDEYFFCNIASEYLYDILRGRDIKEVLSELDCMSRNVKNEILDKDLSGDEFVKAVKIRGIYIRVADFIRKLAILVDSDKLKKFAVEVSYSIFPPEMITKWMPIWGNKPIAAETAEEAADIAIKGYGQRGLRVRVYEVAEANSGWERNGGYAIFER